MGLLRSLSVLLVWLFFLLRLVRPQLAPSSLTAAKALDGRLQNYAFGAILPPKTGIIYDADLPSNFTGIKVSALRLRSGSLRTKGVLYKEFQIPTGVVEKPYVERLVLVYQNLGNRSSLYYPLSGYIFMAPVLGLLAYDASNLSSTGLPELDIAATEAPISIRFLPMRSVPDGSLAKCVSIDLQGFVNFSNMLPENTCTAFTQGHFSIVMRSIGPSPAPLPPSLTPPEEAPLPKAGSQAKKNSKTWIVIGGVLGGLALLILLGLLVVWTLKSQRNKRMLQMEKAAESGEALHMTRIGSTKAPAAAVTRTQPTLETEYVP